VEISVTTNGSRLWAEGLTKVYRGRKVVNDVAISVRQGETVGLLGPNGAGKTTTFYMMVGLIPPAEGTVHLDDDDLTRVPMYKRARRGIGYLAQEPSVFRKLSVEDNVLAIVETLKLSKSEQRQRVDELLGESGPSAALRRSAYARQTNRPRHVRARPARAQP
jgi:lipopolysaccharide export system ATP-binding protein